MVEMIRVNLNALMQQVILTHDGEDVPVDGFRLRDAPDVVYALTQPVSQTAQPNRTTQPPSQTANQTEGNRP